MLQDVRLGFGNDSLFLFFSRDVDFPDSVQEISVLLVKKEEKNTPVAVFTYIRNSAELPHQEISLSNESLVLVDSTYLKACRAGDRLPATKLSYYVTPGDGKGRNVMTHTETKENEPVCAFFSNDSAAFLTLANIKGMPTDSIRVFRQVMKKDLVKEELLFSSVFSDTLPIRHSDPDIRRFIVKMDDYPLCQTRIVKPYKIQELSLAEELPELPKKKIKTPSILKALTDNRLFSGSIVSENRFQNNRRNESYQPLSYSRLYTSFSINILGLPFSISSLHTTESSGNNNLNYFNFSFNKEKFDGNLKLQREAVSRLFDSREAELRNKLRAYENGLHKMQLNDSLMQGSRLKDSLLSAQELLKDSFDHTKYLPDSLIFPDWKQYKPSPADSLPALPDTLLPAYGMPDSQYKNPRQAEMDSVKDRIRDIQEKIQLLKNALEKLSGSKEKAMKLLEKANSFSSLEKFQVGLVSGNFSDFSIKGLAVKGGEIKGSHKNMTLHLIHGKSMPPQTSFITTQEAKHFTRNTSGLQFSFSSENITNKFSFAYFNDPLAADTSLSRHGRNLVLSYYNESKITENIRAGGEIGLSNTQYHRTLRANGEPVENQIAPSFRYLTKKNSAFMVFASGEIKKLRTLLKVAAKRLSPEFTSFGLPFLRVDYKELEVSSETRLFREKLKIKANVKSNENNLDNNKSYTTKMRGMGISVSTSFKKWPNASISYQPFMASSEYTPTSYTTHAPAYDFSMMTYSDILTANISHGFTAAGQHFSTMAMYMSNKISSNEIKDVAHSFNVFLKGIHSRNLESELSYSDSRRPLIATDSLNYSTASLLFDYLLKKAKLGGGFLHERMGHKSGRLAGVIRGSSSFRGIVFIWSCEAGIINKSIYATRARPDLSSTLTARYLF